MLGTIAWPGFRDTKILWRGDLRTNCSGRCCRFRPGEFARFLNFARGSLTETHNSLRDGRDRGYFAPADCDRLSRLAGRAAKATTRLMLYLQSCAG